MITLYIYLRLNMIVKKIKKILNITKKNYLSQESFSSRKLGAVHSRKIERERKKRKKETERVSEVKKEKESLCVCVCVCER